MRLLRSLLPVLALAAALAGCSGSGGSRASGYQAPPRPQPVLPESLDIHGCSSSTMGGTLLAVCDPVLLQKAWENHTLTQHGDLRVEIAGREIRVGSNPGLTQVVPADGIGSLGVPAKVTLQGTASDGSYLYVHAFSLKPDHYATGEALFRHIGLEHGGTATIDVKLEDGRVAFELRRPDGSDLPPLRYSHVDGPGAHAELPRLPAHYADTPQQALRTYVAALSGHDGKTICELWTADVRALWVHEDYPCWASVTGLLSAGGENSGPLQRVELLRVGKPYSRKSYGVSFTAVPVTVRTHIGTSGYLTEPETREARTTIWFRKTGDGWRIAKDPLSASSEDASAPPDPYAAQHARQAEQRKERMQRALRARTLVRLRPAVSCPRAVLTLKDGSRDPEVRTQQLSAGADVVAASAALEGRRACFSVRFRGRPLTGGERVELSLSYNPSDPVQRRYARFQVDDDFRTADGLHAGLVDPSLGPDDARPAQARVGAQGKTISASFRLPSSFPSLRRRQLADLALTISSVARNGALYVSDRAEAGQTDEKLAAAAAKAAQARRAKEQAAEQRRKAAAWAPALVRFGSGRVRCRGKAVSAADTASDVMLLRSRQVTVKSPLNAVSDIRRATVAVSGRHVCFAGSFAKQPFGRRQRRLALQVGLGLAYKIKGPPYLLRASFAVETNTHFENGLTYGGLYPQGEAILRPARAHVELRGNTVRADFDLDPSFPSLRPRDLKRLTWTVSFSGSNAPSLPEGVVALDSHDQLPNNPDENAVSPEIRQSDGRTVKPY